MSGSLDREMQRRAWDDLPVGSPKSRAIGPGPYYSGQTAMRLLPLLLVCTAHRGFGWNSMTVSLNLRLRTMQFSCIEKTFVPFVRSGLRRSWNQQSVSPALWNHFQRVKRCNSFGVSWSLLHTHCTSNEIYNCSPARLTPLQSTNGNADKQWPDFSPVDTAALTDKVFLLSDKRAWPCQLCLITHSLRRSYHQPASAPLSHS